MLTITHTQPFYGQQSQFYCLHAHADSTATSTFR